jgi:hypothetical protein
VTHVSSILARAELGNPKAASELQTVVYEELRRLAALKMANEAKKRRSDYVVAFSGVECVSEEPDKFRLFCCTGAEVKH